MDLTRRYCATINPLIRKAEGMEDTGRATVPAGREVQVLTFGNTANEIELAALDEARPFFGEQARLMVVPDYRASAVGNGPHKALAAGGKYQATVTVRAIEPGDS